MIAVDTNVVSETMRAKPNTNVTAWFERNDKDIIIPSVVIGEIAFGIERIRPDERAPRLQLSLDAFRRRFAGRVLVFDEDAAIIYGRILGHSARTGRIMTTPDGMIAAIAIRHQCPLATRNSKHFLIDGLQIINPWT